MRAEARFLRFRPLSDMPRVKVGVTEVPALSSGRHNAVDVSTVMGGAQLDRDVTFNRKWLRNGPCPTTGDTTAPELNFNPQHPLSLHGFTNVGKACIMNIAERS